MLIGSHLELGQCKKLLVSETTATFAKHLSYITEKFVSFIYDKSSKNEWPQTRDYLFHKIDKHPDPVDNDINRVYLCMTVLKSLFLCKLNLMCSDHLCNKCT